jgi:uncharacterized protein (TIGR00255 family)
MTAYGRSDLELGNNLLTAEIKTLNNRYRDIILRLPATLQVYEEFIRAEISDRIKRGRVEVSMQITAGDETTCNLELNRPCLMPIVKYLMRSTGNLAQMKGLSLNSFYRSEMQ